jgi:hypothetical protein
MPTKAGQQYIIFREISDFGTRCQGVGQELRLNGRVLPTAVEAL